MSKIDVLLGLQWGDEGKGKVVDVLAPRYDIIARFQGGPNAGHTLEFEGIKHVLHIIPSGICHRDKINVIGNGVLVEPVILRKEFAALESIGFEPRTNLYISRKAHLILPTHRLLDAANEASKAERKIGSTLKGIGPAYTDKVARVGVRVSDIARSDFKAVYEKAKESHLNLIRSLGYDVDAFRVEDKTLSEYERQWFEALDFLKGLKVIDSEYYLNEALNKGLKILAEGAQGSMLDIDFGSYPFVTSSNTITAGVCSGLGIAPSRVGKVFGICKAYCTRVGSGPFPTELFDADGEELRQKGREFGSTTGRPRRCGWLDIPALRYACMLNGVTHLMLMKIDVMNGFSRIKVCDSYEINGKRTMNVPYDMEERISPLYSDYEGWLQDVGGVGDYEALPQRMKDYIAMIEQKTGLPVALVSTSPDRKDTIIRTEL
ncbi:MAG TPA: adenylosuccinate synthase [Candidatus Onthomorpha intestinigallinarum]|uniref:Adenylosuccinate synthetase n=1 Tax=Candidatus Onthomorpha intestinigallinarum TaxID=2840880 RepID=A0A9D1UHD6_9BACT|nr:adenylosuccinate synthase [Candidatus Onthomorpha intestinigallinarum]